MRQHYHLSPGDKVNPAELSKYLDEIGRRLAAIESTHRVEGLPIPNPLGTSASPSKGSNLLSAAVNGPSVTSSSPGGSSVFNPGIVTAPLPLPGKTPMQAGQKSAVISLPPDNLIASSTLGTVNSIAGLPVNIPNGVKTTFLTVASDSYARLDRVLIFVTCRGTQLAAGTVVDLTIESGAGVILCVGRVLIDSSNVFANQGGFSFAGFFTQNEFTDTLNATALQNSGGLVQFSAIAMTVINLGGN